MASERPVLAFDVSGDYAAVVGVDGTLRLWDTVAGSVRQEHPRGPSQLADPFTAVALSPAVRTKGKARGIPERAAVGTLQGGVVLVDLVHGRQTPFETKGHSARVNAVVWHGDSEFYTAGDDKLIVQWSVQGQILGKWKGDKHAVTALAISADGKSLLSAGRTIKLWDIETRKCTRKYTGHENPAVAVAFAPVGGLFVSAAQEERLVSVWSTDDEGGDGERTAVAFMALDAPAIALSVSPVAESDGKAVCVAAVSQSGAVHVFRQSSARKQLAKRTVSKPAAAGAVLTFRAEGDDSPIAVLAASFPSVANGAVVVARGSHVRPVFERVPINDESGNLRGATVLKRATASGLLLGEQTGKGRKSKSSEDVTMLGPGDMALPEVAKVAEGKRAKREAEDEPSLGEKLSKMGIDEAADASRSKGARAPPKAHSLAQMLVQGLHSGDAQLIEECLANTNEGVVKNTVRRLPNAYVVRFLTQIVNRFQAKPSRGLALVVWIRAVLVIHAAYLMSSPDLVRSLGGLYQLVDARLAVFKKLMKLSGRLDLILSQISARQSGMTVDNLEELRQAAVVYEEDSDEGSEADADDVGDSDDENAEDGDEEGAEAMDLDDMADGSDEEEGDEDMESAEDDDDDDDV